MRTPTPISDTISSSSTGDNVVPTVTEESTRVYEAGAQTNCFDQLGGCTAYCKQGTLAESVVS